MNRLDELGESACCAIVVDTPFVHHYAIPVNDRVLCAKMIYKIHPGHLEHCCKRPVISVPNGCQTLDKSLIAFIAGNGIFKMPELITI